MLVPAQAPSFVRKGFTLVELLVVIGIIALLISILLPALSAARRQAAAAKCAAELREIGNAFLMYANDSKGWFPPAQLQPVSSYNIDGVDYPTNASGTKYNAYWFNFLAKYVTKAKTGGSVSTAQESARARGTIIWGCPAWEGYLTTSEVGGLRVVQTGYGMNPWPTHAANYPLPPGQHPPITERVFITSWGDPSQQGNFIRQNIWGKRGAERCLVADSLFWEAEAERVPPPDGMIGQALATNNTAAGNWAFGTGNTLVDCYRHGKYPPSSGDGASLKLTGGLVGYNMLFVDGHVGRMVDRRDAFRALRLRYPE